MTRILQIKRGTAVDNENYTGLIGETTMDMENNTVRLHDGETAGGHELARADMSNVDLSGFTNNNPGFFDINSVAGEFWEALFLEHNIRSNNFAISDPVSLATAPYIEYTFDGCQPDDITKITADCVLSCKTAEAGYKIGDIAHAFGIGTRTAGRPITFMGVNGLCSRIATGNDSFWVANKSSGIQTPITNANWKIIFRVWY